MSGTLHGVVPEAERVTELESHGVRTHGFQSGTSSRRIRHDKGRNGVVRQPLELSDVEVISGDREIDKIDEQLSRDGLLERTAQVMGRKAAQRLVNKRAVCGVDKVQDLTERVYSQGHGDASGAGFCKARKEEVAEVGRADSEEGLVCWKTDAVGGGEDNVGEWGVCRGMEQG